MCTQGFEALAYHLHVEAGIGFFVFGIASVLVFPSVFFPFVDARTATFYSFAIFSLAFVARPFGSALFRVIHERYGRGAKLTIALFVLGTATAGIAFLPSYKTLGEWSIVLLALMRMAQGFGIAGSWDGLPSLLALNAPENRRGWFAMLPQLGGPIGFFIAAGLFAFLITRAGVPDAIGRWLEAVLQSPAMFLLGVNAALFVIGMFIETSAAIIVLAPILAPVAIHFGIDPVHFGLVMVVNLALGMITPPFGVNLFAACTVARISLDRIVKHLIPFVLVILACLMVITYVPAVSLTLRDLAYAK